MSISTIMILAAGFGKRMKQYSKKIPKPLIKIGNETLIEKIIKKLEINGFKRIVINIFYLKNKIKKEIGKKFKTQIHYSEEKILLNTGGGIKNALRFLGGNNFIVTNSDILWKENNIEDVINFINNYQKIETCKLLLSNDNHFDGLKKTVGDFKYEDSLVKRWKKNDPYLYYTGLQIINPIVFKLIDDVSFSVNKLWDLLIAQDNLQGQISNSNIAHIGDINAYNQFKDD